MKIDSLYTRKGLMPSFYKARSFFGVEDWITLDPNKLFKSFKEKVPKAKYKKTIKELFDITKMLNKEVYLVYDYNEKKDCYGEYDNNRKLITMFKNENPFNDFAAIAFHEMVHLLQYNEEKCKDSAICAKYEYRISIAWLMEMTANITAKKIFKYIYPTSKYNKIMLNSYKTIEDVKFLYSYQDKFWKKEFKTKNNFVIDDLNILKK